MTAASASKTSKIRGFFRRARDIWDNHPVLTFYLILIPTLLLVIIGALIVFSASTIEALNEDVNPFLAFRRNGLIIVLSLLIMWAASKLKQSWYVYGSIPFLGLTWVLQLGIFTSNARSEYGNNNWVLIPVINQVVQPSEFIKLALAIYLGVFLRQISQYESAQDWILFVGIASVGSVALVLMGRDMGTALVFAALIMGAFLIAGIPWKALGIMTLVGLAGAAAGVMISPNRRNRIFGFIDSASVDPSSLGYQRKHGLWGLATGGMWGVGPGGSREKWSYLPEAATDFIFAILGEEYGFAGTLTVLILYAMLALGLYRMIRRHRDPMARIYAGAIMSWIFSQAIINIGAVTGMMPIIGVPLPLLSSGGSAMLSTLAAIGVALNFAKTEPGAAEVMKARSRWARATSAVISSIRRKRD